MMGFVNKQNRKKQKKRSRKRKRAHMSSAVSAIVVVMVGEPLMISAQAMSHTQVTKDTRKYQDEKQIPVQNVE